MAADQKAKTSADAATTGSCRQSQKRSRCRGKPIARDLDRRLVTTKTQLEEVEKKRAELERSLINIARSVPRQECYRFGL